MSEASDVARRSDHPRGQGEKEDLARLVVHDMKSPIASMLLNLSLALEESLPERTRVALENAKASAEALHRLAMNLLDISRSEEGRLVAVRRETDIGELVRDVAEPLRARAGRGRKRIVVEGSATAQVDPELLRRIVENLVDNSLRYAPAGTTIRIETLLNGSLQIRVRDEGPGIPAEAREKIFEKYAKLDPVRDERTSRGMGLAFCRIAAAAHGGTVHVEDNEPRGACFVVRLPVVPARLSEARA